MKLIAPFPHAILDYSLAVLFLVAPPLLRFESAGAIGLARGIGAVYVVAALLTRYPLGALPLIPFPVHGVLEALMALVWIALPWIAGFSDEAAARNFYCVAGAALLMLAWLTDYEAAGAPASGDERRRRTTDRRRHGRPGDRRRQQAVTKLQGTSGAR
ncbi:MAG: hypothetical protein ACM30H_14570 [Clostridia bacterium]